MKWVDLVEFDAATQKGSVSLRVTLENGKVAFEGDATLAARLSKDGVFSPSEGKMLKPEDGEAFLAALRQEFRTPYLFASGVQEGDKPTPFEQPPMQDVPKDGQQAA